MPYLCYPFTKQGGPSSTILNIKLSNIMWSISSSGTESRKAWQGQLGPGQRGSGQADLPRLGGNGLGWNVAGMGKTYGKQGDLTNGKWWKNAGKRSFNHERWWKMMEKRWKKVIERLENCDFTHDLAYFHKIKMKEHVNVTKYILDL